MGKAAYRITGPTLVLCGQVSSLYFLSLEHRANGIMAQFTLNTVVLSNNPLPSVVLRMGLALLLPS